MSRTTLLVLLVLAAAGLGTWLLVGGTSSRHLDGRGEAAQGDTEAALLGGTTAGDAADAADAVRKRVPTLLGQGRPRIGVGALTGRVARHPSGEPVVGLAVQVSGTGHGGEVVSLALVTDGLGAFHASEVPASDELHLLLGRSDDADHRLLVVHVEPGNVTDLGTLLLGQASALSGRVLDAQGKGVVGARVEVHRRLFRSATTLESFHLVFRDLGRTAEPLAAAVSGPQGAFRVEGAPAGDITFVVTATGFAPLIRHHRVGAEEATGAGLTLSLVAARRAAGRVLDVDGRGVPEAIVAFVADVSGPESFRYAGVFAATDRHGRFEDAAVPPGSSVQAIVVAEGHPPGIFSLHGARMDEDLVFTLGARATTEVHVYDAATREPVEGADLLFVFGEVGAGRSRRNSIASVVTDERGLATFPTEPGPVMWVMVRHPVWGSLAWMGQGMPGGMGVGIEAPEGGFVVKEGFHRLDVGVRAPSWVEGRVTTKDGAPVVGAQVSVQSGLGGRMSMLTGAEGRYRLPMTTMLGGFMPILVQASAPGLVLEGGEVKLADGDAPQVDAGSAAPRVVQQDLVLVPAVLVLGRVVSDQGQPIAGAEVTVEGRGGDREMRSAPRGHEATTDARGRFVLDGLDGGAKDVTLHVAHADFLSNDSPKLTLPDRGELRADDIVLASGTTLTVTVVDADGQPVEGLSLTLSPPGQRWRQRQSGTTNTAGEARFHHVASGANEFAIEDPRYAHLESQHDVPEGPTHALRLVVQAARALEARVVTEGDTPVEGVRLMVQKGVTNQGGTTTWSPVDMVVSDDDGRVRVGGLAQGEPVRLHVEHDDHRTVDVDVPPDALEVRVVLVPLSAAAKARIAELEEELQQLMIRVQQAMQAGPPGTLQERMEAFNTDRQRLSGELERLRRDGE